LGCLYKFHEDKDFEEAISQYQDGKIQLLKDWLDKQESITNVDHIHEIIHQLFMIGDCYFVDGTSSVFPKAFKKFQLHPEDSLSEVARAEVCPDVWFENPVDFKRLFYAYEDAFCSKELNIKNKSLKTVADHFSHRRTNTLDGFWKAVSDFHGNAKFQKHSLHNLIANVELWLTKIPQAKEFVQPYCLPINGEVNFSHLAYAFLNHGFTIEKDILHLYPTSWPEQIEPFKSAAQYYELNHEIANSNNTEEKKRFKL
jgi:hypothetical protein